jgi:hypothetical protein
MSFRVLSVGKLFLRKATSKWVEDQVMGIVIFRDKTREEEC